MATMVWLAGCFSPDPRQVDGAIAKALTAATEGDARVLYSVIDERARHAMISIVHDRRASAARIRETYPEAEQAAALTALGDAAQAEDAADLFSMRCPKACLEGFRSRLAAPVERTTEGRVVHVTTTRGTKLTLYKGSDTWHGLVWHTEELSRERDRAAAEHEVIERNAALYEKRRALEAPNPNGS